MRTTYGIKTSRRDDEYIEAAERLNHYLGQLLVPGQFWVECAGSLSLPADSTDQRLAFSLSVCLSAQMNANAT
jgi:hypothetical protein